MTIPFNIQSSDIKQLDDFQLTQLLKELLHAEAIKFGIAQKAVEVALNIRAGDGGEDGRISWNDGPEKTDYIPSRLTMFQNKATEMGPAAYANEILTTARRNNPSILKPKVEEILDQDGCYIFFTTQELNTQQKDTRIGAVRAKLNEYGKAYAEISDIHIYDASQIAGWVNNYISTIVSVQHWLGYPVERGLKNFKLWSEYEDISRLPFVFVESRNSLIEQLKEEVSIPKSCFRITGLSGLGKTRTAFQVFFEEESAKNLVVYIDANYTSNIDALVSDWVSLGHRAILVVDNCEYRLHESLVREVRREGSQISLLSLDYNFDTVSSPTLLFKLEQMTDNEIFQLLNPIYKDLLPDLERVANFAQGFPQMAVLLAEARLNEDPRLGFLTEDELANKLLWKRDEVENINYIKILQVCSLFDVFGIEKEVEYQLKYIAGISGINVDDVFECINKYSERGIVDWRGRFGQIVPKPLAIRLAGQWWSQSREQKQKDFVDGIPNNMVDSFCQQIEKMDFHTEVKALSESLCGPQSPFGQAEEILSNRGSRLFRSFVVVNPDATSSALYRVANVLDHDALKAIEGDTRRNLVWALEKLCFHAHLFEDSAWSLLLLASAENETWSNNATGIFSQLFRVNGSGTEAEPDVRFSVLHRAFDVDKSEVDMVILEALKYAISVSGGSRSVGAEYQGTKAPLQEWKATIWQEIFDYWQTAFDFLLGMLDRGETQKEKVMDIIGRSIRGFVSRGRIEMLDSAINKIVGVNGRYWPAALENIKNAIKYDTKNMQQEGVDALNAWLTLLNPDNSDLSEKIKILVSNPPWEHRRDGQGHYEDIAGENAKTLATEVAKDINAFYSKIPDLLQGEQKKAIVFGHQLVNELDEYNELIDKTLELLQDVDSQNINFVTGLYQGIYEKSQKSWQYYINRLLDIPLLVIYYPDLIRTGDINECHLDKLMELIKDNTVSVSSVNLLSYGSSIDKLMPKPISDFCVELSQHGEKHAWVALNIIFMYWFGNKECLEEIRNNLKALVLAISFPEEQRVFHTDIYHWHELAKNILCTEDEEFAILLSKQLINGCKQDFNHGDISEYIKPLLSEIMGQYGIALWPLFGEAIKTGKGLELYWLQQLLDREDSFSNPQDSILSLLPTEEVIEWCERNKDKGPKFVASCINIFEIEDEVQKPTRLFIAILEKFGDDPSVVNNLNANLGTKSWSGSLVPYLEVDKTALMPLLEHTSRNIRSWTKGYIEQMDRQIEYESTRDDEERFGAH